MADAALPTPATRPAARRGLFAANALPITIFLLFAILPLFAFRAEVYVLSLVTRVMIFAIAALALDLLIGYGALISFGHAAFIGLGAYAVGILAAHGIGDALVSLPVALAASALYAFLTGIVCLRTKGVYFIMITLAFGQMAFFTASSLAPYGGDDGLTIAARSTFAGFPLLKNERAFYYVVFVALLGTYLFCRALVGSRFGRVLRGAKENPVRMAAMMSRTLSRNSGVAVVARVRISRSSVGDRSTSRTRRRRGTTSRLMAAASPRAPPGCPMHRRPGGGRAASGPGRLAPRSGPRPCPRGRAG